MSQILFETQTFERNQKPTEKERNEESFSLISVAFMVIIVTLSGIFAGKPFAIVVGIICFFVFNNWHEKKFGEFLYGTFVKDLIITEEYIQIGESTFPYTKIDSIRFEKIFYKNEGPSKAKQPGIQNVIIIYSQGEEVKEHFYIKDKLHLTRFFKALIFIICNEKITYRREYLNFIRDEYKHSSVVFEEFIAKLIKERKLDCTEALLLIGYNSDAEAKELRAKYCS